MKILESGQNVFLTGKAGVGKSTLLREFLARAKTAKKKCVVCAPTGLAALNIDGITLHRCFNIKIGPLGPDEPREEWFQPSDILQQADVIVIDEISMCRFDAFSYVCRYLTLLKRKIQVVLVGDFFQLPPVIREDDASALKRLWDNGEIGEGFAFLSHYWSELNLITINLQQVMRQSDVDFINVLNSIRSNSGEDADVLAWLKENSEKNKAENPTLYADAVRIVPYKKTAEAINRKKLAEIKGKEYVYEGQVIDDFTVSDAPVEQTLSLKAGARVMALANDPEGRYVNGSTGVVIRCNKKSKTILVRFDNGNRVGVSPYTWKKFQYE
ncbi:MAG: AAA family ATPase, partial [Synergistaceae bacterium]|nr:AAA family ATPase [Synergistaceae bacterium]